MSKYDIEVWEYADTFKNLDTNETFGGVQACELLEQKDQRIAQLEEQLKNAIVPKFETGQDIFFIDNEYQITQGVVDIILTGQDVFEKWCKYSIDLGTEYEDDIRFVDKDEEEIFATEEEARKRQEELKGE